MNFVWENGRESGGSENLEENGVIQSGEEWVSEGKGGRRDDG